MQFVRQVEREPLEKIRRSPELPGDLSGTVDKSGLVLANAAANASDVFAANAQRMQDDRDKAKVNQAVAGWIKRDQDYKYNKDKGILFKTGADANGLYVKTQDEQDGWRKEISGSLENDRQRQMFAAAIVPHETSSQIEVSKYEASESKKWNAEQADDLVKTQAGVLANGAYKTQEGRAAALASAQQAAATIYGAEQDPQQAAKHVKEMMAALVSSAAGIMEQSDPGSLPSFVEANKDYFDPVQYNKMMAAADKAALPVKAQGLSEELYKKFGGDLGDAEDYIRKTYSGNEEDYYLGKTEGYFGDMKRAVAEDQAKVFDTFVVQIGKHAGSASALKAAINNDKTLDEKQKMQLSDAVDSEFKVGDYAPRRSGGGGYGGGGGSDGGRVKTDRDTLMKLYNMVDKRQLFKDSPDWATFYNKYGTKLSTTDLKSFRSLYPGGAGGKGGKPAMSMNLMETFNKHMNNDKITDLQERAVYIDAFNAAHDEAVREKGAELTAQENELVMARVLEPVSVKSAEKSWWGGVKYKDLRRGDIPDGVTQNANGDYGVKDKNGHWHEVFWDNGSLSTGGKKPAQSKQKSPGKDWDIPAL